jgi:hypothetical protein
VRRRALIDKKGGECARCLTSTPAISSSAFFNLGDTRSANTAFLKAKELGGAAGKAADGNRRAQRQPEQRGAQHRTQTDLQAEPDNRPKRAVTGPQQRQRLLQRLGQTAARCRNGVGRTRQLPPTQLFLEGKLCFEHNSTNTLNVYFY